MKCSHEQRKLNRQEKLRREQSEMKTQMLARPESKMIVQAATPSPRPTKTKKPYPKWQEKYPDRNDGLCACGCGNPTKIYKGKSRKFVLGHQIRKPGLPYTISEKTGCWVWQRSVSSNDYGCISVNGKNELAHRYFYEKHRGPIPTGMQLDHLCMNKLCVNPDHLEVVTQKENTARYRRFVNNH